MYSIWVTCPKCGWINYSRSLRERYGYCRSCKGYLSIPGEKKEEEMAPEKDRKVKHTIPLTNDQAKEFIRETADKLNGWELMATYDPDAIGHCSGKGRVGIEFPFKVETIEELYDYMHEYIPSTAPAPIPITAWVCFDCNKAYQFERLTGTNPKCPKCGEVLDLYESA